MTAADPAGRRRRVRLRAVLAVCAVLAIGVLYDVTTREPGLNRLLAVRAVAVLEQAPPGQAAPAAHPGHGGRAQPGHRVGIDGNELLCAARTFGYEPADARSVADVRVIYVHHMCG